MAKSFKNSLVSESESFIEFQNHNLPPPDANNHKLIKRLQAKYGISNPAPIVKPVKKPPQMYTNMGLRKAQSSSNAAYSDSFTQFRPPKKNKAKKRIVMGGKLPEISNGGMLPKIKS